MSKLPPDSNSASYEDLTRRAIDLVEGRGSEISRKLTREVLRTFPSIAALVPYAYQNRLSKLLAEEEK